MYHLKLTLTPNEAGIYIYKPGDVMRGCIELDTKSDENFSSLCIEIIGQVITHDNAEYNSKGRNVHLYKKITFFDHLNPKPIPCEKNQHEFEFELPSNLPYSLKIDAGNKIEYFVKASLVIKGGSKNVEQRIDFEIFSEYDLKVNSLNFIGQHSEGVVKLCPLFCEKGTIIFSSSIPITGYVEGQMIPVTIKYINQSNAKVFGIVINFVQLIEIKCDTPELSKIYSENKITSKKFPDTELEQKMFSFSKASNEFKIFMTVPFGIHLSNSHVCDLIKIKYALDVIMITNSYRDSLQLKMPIEIGTKRISSTRIEEGRNEISVIAENNQDFSTEFHE